MIELAKELRRALLLRADAIEEIIGSYRGRLGDVDLPIANALDLFGHYPQVLREEIKLLWDHYVDNPHSLVENIRPYLIHQAEVRTFLTEWLTRGSQSGIPFYLISSIERSYAELGLGDARAIVVVGSADDYVTSFYNIKKMLFRPIERATDLIPDDSETENYVVVKVPLFEGRTVLWNPIVLGHELAHSAVEHYGTLNKLQFGALVKGAKDASWPIPGVLPEDRATVVLAVEQTAQMWATELLCDAYAVRVYGAGGVASLGEYIEAVGQTYKEIDTHPPGALRIELMLEWLRADNPMLKDIVKPLSSHTGYPPEYGTPWVDHLVKFFRDHSHDIFIQVQQWPGRVYDCDASAHIVKKIYDDFECGLPGAHEYEDGAKSRIAVTDSDVITAAWLARVKLSRMPYVDLAQKTLENIEFLERWNNIADPELES